MVEDADGGIVGGPWAGGRVLLDVQFHQARLSPSDIFHDVAERGLGPGEVGWWLLMSTSASQVSGCVRQRTVPVGFSLATTVMMKCIVVA